MTIRKTKKKRSQSNKAAAKTRRSASKSAARKTGARKAVTKKKVIARKKAAVKKKSKRKTLSSNKTQPARTKALRPRSQSQESRQESFSVDTEATELQQRRSRSAGQSGDLQGLSGGEFSDSESVDELLEEGNSFEAGIVSGVEDSADDEEQEVRTREIPEDDVPGEYLDRD